MSTSAEHFLSHATFALFAKSLFENGVTPNCITDPSTLAIQKGAIVSVGKGVLTDIFPLPQFRHIIERGYSAAPQIGQFAADMAGVAAFVVAQQIH